MSDIVISLKNVNKHYKVENTIVEALTDINLDIHKGEIIAVVGRSGSGKSTLLNVIGCMDTITSGTYLIEDINVSNLKVDNKAGLRGHLFGFVFQKYNLLKNLSVLDNVCLPAIYKGISRIDRERKALDILSRFEMQHKSSCIPSQLSGGQQQRVCIARAIINDADIILADEPTGALDIKSGEIVIAALNELNDMGKTILIVTHDMNVAEIAHRIVELQDGRVISIKTNSVSENVPNLGLCIEKTTIKWRDSVFNAFFLGWKSLRFSPLRTFLTMLGIIIGIMSVVLVTAIGNGAKNNIMNEINHFGNYSIDIFPGAGFDDQTPGINEALKPNDLNGLSFLPDIKWISPVIYSVNNVRHQGSEVQVNVLGVSENYLNMNSLSLEKGGFLLEKDISSSSQYVVIDTELEKILFDDKGALGETIIIGTVPCVVIGVIKPRTPMIFQSMSPTLWLPYTSLIHRFGSNNFFNKIQVELSDYKSITQKNNIQKHIEDLHGRKDFFIQDNAENGKSVERVYFILSLMISSIAMVSLVVGGIGVMNMMVVSVNERKRDIAISMALGARQRDIFYQFIFEAVFITFSGCIAGIVFSFFSCLFLNSLQNYIFLAVSLTSIFGSVLISIFVGIVFGLYPARKAARLNPVLYISYE